MLHQLSKIISFILLFAATVSAMAASTQTSQDQKLDLFFKQYLDELFQQRPLEATRLGDHRFDNRLDDISPQARAAWLAHARKTLKDLSAAVNYSQLSR